MSFRGLYPLLLAGDTPALAAMFSGEPSIDTPRSGRVSGRAAFERYVRDEQAWLREREARSEPVARIDTAEREVVEVVLYLRERGDLVDLPVAIVADLVGGGAAAVRVYHSMWPLTGKHAVRAPLLSPVTELREPKVIERYMAALAKPDAEAILALFTEDGYAREPSGSRYRHAGARERRAFYQGILSGGGIQLRHCSATFDGVRCAIEYVCDRWGKTALAPQAGVAVYELAASDRLRAARIYDDVSPPGETRG